MDLQKAEEWDSIDEQKNEIVEIIDDKLIVLNHWVVEQREEVEIWLDDLLFDEPEKQEET